MKKYFVAGALLFLSLPSFAAITDGTFGCQGENEAEATSIVLKNGAKHAQVRFLDAGVKVDFQCELEPNPYSVGGEKLNCRSSGSNYDDLIIQTNHATKNDFLIYALLSGSDYTQITGSTALNLQLACLKQLK